MNLTFLWSHNDNNNTNTTTNNDNNNNDNDDNNNNNDNDNDNDNDDNDNNNFTLLYSAISSRSQHFYITDTVHIIQCNLVAAANQRQLRHSNTQNKTWIGKHVAWLSHDSFAQFSNGPWE